MITDENNVTAGKYCGVLTGKEVVVAGDYAVITFHSDCSLQYKGYRIIFTTDQPSKCTLIAMLCPLNKIHETMIALHFTKH